MVETSDIQNLLQTGSWTTSRAKSPNRVASPPVRANQASKLDRVPGKVHIKFDTKRFPPPPSVEDEAEALKREHGGSVVSSSSEEEPKCRGDIEQQPIILPVHEHNPERRFVIVSNSPDATEDEFLEDDGPTPVPSQKRSSYAANTGRKVSLNPDGSDGDQGRIKRPERRKSRQDLPQLETAFEKESSQPSGTHRPRSATYIDQQPRDYFDRQEHTRAPGDELLSPVIKHSTKGRDRAYWDFSAGVGAGVGAGLAAGAAMASQSRSSHDAREIVNDDRRREVEYTRPSHSHSTGPPMHKRSNSVKEANYSRRQADKYNSHDEPSSPRDARKRSPPRVERRASSPPPKLDRKGSSPPYSQSARERERLPSRGSSYKAPRESPPREEDEYDSDGYAKQRSDRPRSRRPTTSIQQEERSSLLSPDGHRPSFGGKPRSRGTTPLASPKIIQNQFPESDPLASPRSSTFPSSKDRRHEDRAVSPFSPAESSPPRSKSRDDRERPSGPRMPSRNPSVKSARGPAPVVVPIPIPSVNTNSNGDSGEKKAAAASLHSRQSSLESSPPKPYWQPPHFDPSANNNNNLEKPIVSYRRYSEDVDSGAIPKLPECSRTTPVAGHMDWLALPRSENFNICPDCYNSVFANSEFRHAFVPAPPRSLDRPIVCDFGTSFWYRIAWVMTSKYRLPDLRLLQGIATINARSQPCAGQRPTTRTWYSMMDPHNRRPIANFNVCFSCAKTVEILFANLVGVFVPLDSPAEPVRGVCAMHFTPERKRFIKYFDLLETTADRALARKSAPRVQELADAVREISLVDECARDEALPHRKWYIMEELPELTVCEECFDEAVWPIVERAETGAIARKFHQRKQLVPMAACQMYSDRMRDAFKKACRRNDFDYLESKVKERLDVEARIKTSLTKLDGKDPDDPRVREEVANLLKEWSSWE